MIIISTNVCYKDILNFSSDKQQLICSICCYNYVLSWLDLSSLTKPFSNWSAYFCWLLVSLANFVELANYFLQSDVCGSKAGGLMQSSDHYLVSSSLMFYLVQHFPLIYLCIKQISAVDARQVLWQVCHYCWGVQYWHPELTHYRRRPLHFDKSGSKLHTVKAYLWQMYFKVFDLHYGWLEDSKCSIGSCNWKKNLCV